MKYPVVPCISEAESAARITNMHAREMGKLKSKRVLIQPFSPDHAYAHHGAITLFRGRIYAMWSSGRVNEDDCGQRVMWSCSTGPDDWMAPRVFADNKMGKDSELVRFAQGFFASEDTLYAYFWEIEYAKEDLQGENLRPLTNTPPCYSQSYCRILNADGLSWGDPIPVAGSCSNHSAERLSSGRYLIATDVGARYTDVPDGISPWKNVRVDQELVEAAKKMGAPELCETSFFETDDGIVHYMMRSGEFKLWHAESYDNGATIGGVYPTSFRDGRAKFQFGRLPDGRYYAVCNPEPSWARIPLALYVSENGYDFNKRYIIRDEPNEIKQKGLFKGGCYGYPECVIHEGYLYVIYSMQKEEMEISCIALDQL